MAAFPGLVSDRAVALVDLDAVRESVGTLARRARGAEVMAVVKADGYGHGAVPCARAALEAGATWLGVALVEEALELRQAGITAPVLVLVEPDNAGMAAAVELGLDVAVGSYRAFSAATQAAERAGRPARAHLKVDTGLGRGGATTADWPGLLARATDAAKEGLVDVIGVWSHFAYADAPGHPTIAAQVARFLQALDVADSAGVRPQVRHLANSAATLTLPDAHFDLVRPGISVYGLSPGLDVGTPASLGLRPAMTFEAKAALVKRLPAGSGVSYAHRYVTERETSIALVPVGYADGVPRNATNTAEVLYGEKRYRIAGTVCMDQFMVDIGDDPPTSHGRVVLFGPGDDGEPTAQEWADALGTINYEIVARVGARVPRVYLGER